MRMSSAGRRLLIELEGSRAGVYRDPAGLPTIGVGHLLTRSERASGKIQICGRPVRYEFGLNDREIDDLLRQDLEKSEACVSAAIGPHVSESVGGVELTQHEFDALVSFVFNVGCRAFTESTLLRKLRLGDKAAVPDQLRRWVYASGQVLDGLAHRREREVDRWRGPERRA